MWCTEGAIFDLRVLSCVIVCLVTSVFTSTAIISDALNLRDNSEQQIAKHPDRAHTLNESQYTTGITGSELPTIDLVIDDTLSTSNELLKVDGQSHKLQRHSYDVSSATPSNISSNDFNADGSTKVIGYDLQKMSNKSTDDPLATSDSRMAPQSVEQTSAEDEESIPDGEDNLLDSASTNLSEKRVLKELAKMLSKGMSGATDQINLNALENLRRRSKQRKQVKDNRAKLFEDLLTAAISTHPERMKKVKESSDGLSNRDKLRENAKSTSALSGLKSVDPELTSDAETVLRHLQSLSSAFVDSDSSEGSSQAGEDMSSSNDLPEGSSISDDSGNNESSSALGENEEKVSTTKKFDRPIVRGFKRIKNQFIQRRKQLDQIKKLFNIELALNPKDGSLMGRPSTSSKRKGAKEQSDHDETSNSSEATSSKKRAPKNKMKELLKYLKENPEILNSVVAELNESNEHNNRASEHSPPSSSLAANVAGVNGFGNEEDSLANPYFNNPAGSVNNYIDPDDVSIGSYTSQKSTLLNSLDRPSESMRSQFEDHLSSLGSRSRKVATRLADALNVDPSDRKRIRTRLSLPKVEFAQQQPPSLTPQSKKSSESTLLESLRERQLMNLARIDLMLAEKHLGFNSSGSQLSKVTQRSSNANDMDQNSIRRDHMSHQSSQHSNQQPNWNQRGFKPINTPSESNRPEEEVAHHFMAVNSDSGYIEDQLSNPGSYRHETNQRYSPTQEFDDSREQNSSNSLKRFKEWRDVSMDETNQLQVNDKMEYMNKNSRDLSAGRSSPQRGGQRNSHERGRPDQSHHQRASTTHDPNLNNRVPYASASSDLHRQSINSNTTNQQQLDVSQLNNQLPVDATGNGQSNQLQSAQFNNDENLAHESKQNEDERIQETDSGASRTIQKRSQRSDISLVRAFEGDDSNKPVDYFSSYTNQRIQQKQEPLKSNKRRRNLADNELDSIASDDNFGALWAS